MVSMLLIFFLSSAELGATADAPRRVTLPSRAGDFGGLRAAAAGGTTAAAEAAALLQGSGSSVAIDSKRQLLELGNICSFELVVVTEAWEHRKGSGSSAVLLWGGRSRQEFRCCGRPSPPLASLRLSLHKLLNGASCLPAEENGL